MATTYTRPTDSMGIAGTFEVFNTETGRWYGTSAEFKTAEATVDLLNQGNGGSYDWWRVR